MGNAISNATFLDGTAGWSGGAVDETVRGAPGRAVLVGNGLSCAAGGGALSEVSVLAALVDGGVPTVTLGGVAVPMVHKATGAPRRGVPRSFHAFRGRIAASGQLAIGGGNVVILHPYVEAVQRWSHRRHFQPGPHASLDLNQPSWPSLLPVPTGVQVQPVPTRRDFQTESRRGQTARLNRLPAFEYRADLVGCDVEQRDALHQFWLTVDGPFWFTRQDTGETCQAMWLPDGEPADSASGNDKSVSFGLQIWVA